MVYYDHCWEGETTSKCQNWVAGLGMMSDVQRGRISRVSPGGASHPRSPARSLRFWGPAGFFFQSNSGIPVGYTWYPHEIPWICPLYQSLNLKIMVFQSVFRDWMGLEGSFSASIAGWKECKTPQKMAGCQQRKLSSLAASVKCGRGATGAFSEESQGLSPGEIAPRTVIPSENLLHTSGKWPIDRWFHVFYPLNWTTWQWTKWPFWKWHVRRASANGYWRIGTWVYGFWNGSAKNGEVLYQQIHVGGWSFR